MKYKCFYKHETHYFNGSWAMSTDWFYIKGKKKEKVEKKANKKINKWNKKYVGEFELISVDEVVKE